MIIKFKVFESSQEPYNGGFYYYIKEYVFLICDMDCCSKSERTFDIRFGSKIYIDGVLRGSSSNLENNNTGTALTVIGKGSNDCWDNLIDEFYFCNVAQDVSWYKFEYWNQVSTAGELTFGLQET